jgi:hypothetical protein
MRLERARLKRHYPLLEGGVAAPTKQMERYLRLGAAGEVKHLCDNRSDLPRNAETEVT